MKKLLLAAILFVGCNQIPEQKPQIFRLYSNSKWYYHNETITIPAGYYVIKGDSIICIQKDSVVNNIVTINK
jgi:hypothetical protein